MQKRVVDEGHAERVESAWYLFRDGEQHGPLTDRELSLFAESANFKPGDLLWTEGLDGWKPADSVFGAASKDAASETAQVAASENAIADDTITEEDAAGDAVFEVDDDAPAPDEAVFVDTAPEPAGAEDEPHPVGTPSEAIDFAPAPDAHGTEELDPDGEQVGALVQALKGEATVPMTRKEQVIHELKSFSGMCGYLWVVFVLLTLHAWVGEVRYGVGLSFFVLSTVNAFWLSKVMPLADGLGFVKDLKHKPLIYSIVYRTVAFSTLLFVTYALETMLFGWIGGGTPGGFMEIGGGPVGTLVLWLIFCVALLPYFAFKELERAVGADMIRKLLLGLR